MDKRFCNQCKFCCTLYIPPTIKNEAKYEKCCTLLLNDGRVMWLENGINCACGYFEEKNSDKIELDYGCIKEYDDCDLWFEPITDIIDGFVIRDKNDGIIKIFMEQ